MPDPQVGKSVVSPRTFLTVQEFIWHNYSAVCGSSVRWLYGGFNDNLVQERLCHTLCGRGLLHPEPLRQPLLTRASTGDTQTCKGRSGSVSVGSLGPGAHVLFEPSKSLWWVWSLILNVILPLLSSFWGLSFALGHGVSFFGGIQHSAGGYSAVSCNFGVLAADEHTSFYSSTTFLSERCPPEPKLRVEG